MTQVLTGRSKSMKPYVEDILHQNNILSLFHRVVCVPDESNQITSEFKKNVVRRMLYEYPNINYIEMYDDDESNLMVLSKMVQKRNQKDNNKYVHLITNHVAANDDLDDGNKEETKNTTTTEKRKKKEGEEDILTSILAKHSLLSTKFNHTTTITIINIISQIWQNILHNYNIHISKNIARQSVLPFGSISYGRKSDLDVVVVGPENMFYNRTTMLASANSGSSTATNLAATTFIDEMCDELNNFGFLTHSNGPDGRLTMVQCRYLNMDIDIIYSPVTVKEYEQFTNMVTIHEKQEEQEEQYIHTKKYNSIFSNWLKNAVRDRAWKDGDTKDALSGPLRSLEIQERISKLAICTTNDFCVLMTGLVAIQNSYDARGTHFLSIRTFQLVEIVLNFLENEVHHFHHHQQQNDLTRMFILLVQHVAQRLKSSTSSSLGSSARFDSTGVMVDRCRLAFLEVSQLFIKKFHNMSSMNNNHLNSTFEGVYNSIINRQSTARPYGTQLIQLKSIKSTEKDAFYFRSCMQKILPDCIRNLYIMGVRFLCFPFSNTHTHTHTHYIISHAKQFFFFLFLFLFLLLLLLCFFYSSTSSSGTTVSM
jgi:hypothetical protein